MSDLNNLNLVDVFWTIQGEGAQAGRSALFVRMPFCNLKCSWCDTEFNTYKPFTDGEFLDICRQQPARFAVVTGGEPMMNKQLSRVLRLLKSMEFTIACETNGTFKINPLVDFVTVSPKAEAKFLISSSAMERAHEFKYVVDKGFDFAVLKRHNTRDGRRYSLSPEWGNREESLARIVPYVAAHPEWRISLQTHKIMGVK